MSTKAHRIKKIEYGGETFNPTQDDDVMNWLENNTGFYSSLDIDDVGIAEISVVNMERLLVEVETLDKYIVDNIKRDIKETKEKGDEYILYRCF